MQKFKFWLESRRFDAEFLENNPMYNYQNVGDSLANRTTIDISKDKTKNGSNATNINNLDPELVGVSQQLQDIHGNLRNIFSSMRNKVNAWGNPTYHAAFNKELMKGVDGVGRANAILLPSVKGTEY